MSSTETDPGYADKLAAEARKWGDHLQLEASDQWHSWLCQPLVEANYQARCRIDGLAWPAWIARQLGRPARLSFDLGCGSGGNSFRLYDHKASRELNGGDISPDRIAQAESRRIAAGIPGQFRVEDANRIQLPPGYYDLIVSTHSFHHFLELESIMEQVHQSLTPEGYFVLEEYVGPTQFQWTESQMQLVRAQLSRIPERLRQFRWNALKECEGRPTPEEVMAVSPFESIRSADIVPLFRKYFEVVEIRKLGGTIQHLLYNGISHHFRLSDPEALAHVRNLCLLENTLIDADVIPSDFMLLVGRRRTPSP